MSTRNRLLNTYLVVGRVLYRLKIEDMEHIPLEGACVIAFNHGARFVDGLTLGAFLQRRPDSVSFGARSLPPSDRIVKLLTRRRRSGNRKRQPYLAAYKARGLSAGQLLKALDLLRRGRAIAVAAEGEVAWDGRLRHPLAPGAAWMALRAHVPVVPIVSIGGYDIMPRWARRPKLTGRITIRAGEPFYVSDGPVTRVTDEMVADASQRIYDRMVVLMFH